MALVILIETPDTFVDYAEQDMRRWWRHRCKKHVVNGEMYFEIGDPKTWAAESVKRLASFGVKARVARRVVPANCIAHLGGKSPLKKTHSEG